MSSIGLFARHSDKKSAVADQPARTRRVLPFVFRRPVRIMNRLLAGSFLITNRGWKALALGLIIVSAAGILSNSRQGHWVIADLSATMGFTINKVIVEGTDELSDADIKSRLDLDNTKSLFSFDIDAARAKLQKLAWVRNVELSKSYPDRLIVNISEYQPFAIWQNENALFVVERGGKPMERYETAHKNYTTLPLLVGKGANIDGAEIIYLVAKVASLKNRIKAYARIAERRWDLHLENGMVIKLPDANPAAALREMARLNDTHDLLLRDLDVVDLRLPGRLVVALGENGRQKRAQQAEDLKSGSVKSSNSMPASSPSLHPILANRGEKT